MDLYTKMRNNIGPLIDSLVAMDDMTGLSVICSICNKEANCSLCPIGLKFDQHLKDLEAETIFQSAQRQIHLKERKDYVLT